MFTHIQSRFIFKRRYVHVWVRSIKTVSSGVCLSELYVCPRRSVYTTGDSASTSIFILAASHPIPTHSISSRPIANIKSQCVCFIFLRFYSHRTCTTSDSGENTFNINYCIYNSGIHSLHNLLTSRKNYVQSDTNFFQLTTNLHVYFFIIIYFFNMNYL